MALMEEIGRCGLELGGAPISICVISIISSIIYDVTIGFMSLGVNRRLLVLGLWYCARAKGCSAPGGWYY